jgi:hypothetical protein
VEGNPERLAKATAFCVAFPYDHSTPAEHRRVETSNGKQSMDVMVYWTCAKQCPSCQIHSVLRKAISDFRSSTESFSPNSWPFTALVFKPSGLKPVGV